MLKLGSYLEATPAYKAAVARQQAKDSERALLALAAPQTRRVMLLPASGPAKIIQITTAVAAPVTVDERAERERLDTWLLMAEYNSQRPSAATILEVNARKHGLKVEDIKVGPNASRKRPIITARHDAVVDLYQKRPDLSTPQIGREMGGMDHTSVLHALKRRGIEKKKRNTLDNVEANRLLDAGMSTEDIAKTLGFSIEAIYKATYQTRSTTTQYERNHATIMQYAHLSLASISKKTGFAKSTVGIHLARARREGNTK